MRSISHLARVGRTLLACTQSVRRQGSLSVEEDLGDFGAFVSAASSRRSFYRRSNGLGFCREMTSVRELIARLIATYRRQRAANVLPKCFASHGIIRT